MEGVLQPEAGRGAGILAPKGATIPEPHHGTWVEKGKDSLLYIHDCDAGPVPPWRKPTRTSMKY